MLDREHAGGQRLGSVVVVYRHRALDDDRARIHLGDDEMHAGAVNLDPGGDRARVRIEPLEGGQQRRVDVEHAAGPVPDEPRRQQPHEAGEADEIDAVCFEHRLHRALERLAVLAMRGVIDDRGRHPGGAGVQQAAGIGTVRQNERDLRREGLRPGGLDQRGHVGAAAGNEDGNAFLATAPDCPPWPILGCPRASVLGNP